MNYITQETRYRGRKIYYQSAEKVWAFNIRNDEGKLERRVRNTLRAAKEVIDADLQGLKS